MKLWLLTLAGLAAVAGIQGSPLEVAALKQEILSRAQAVSGRADPGFEIQRQFDPLVARIVELSSPAPVEQRMHVLEGTWKQVWGPYNYRSNDRSLDPSLDTSSIYQHVRRDGAYFNACVVYEKGDRARPRVSLLRGELEASASGPNHLRFQFTDYLKVAGEQERLLALPELAARFAQGQLKQVKPVVPGWLVRVISDDGILNEVYTDDTMRLLYAYPRGEPEKAHLYVMTRVTPSARSVAALPQSASYD